MRLGRWLVVAGIVGGLLVGEDGLASAHADDSSTEAEAPARTTGGLRALYDFRNDGGPVVKDRSGAGRPLDLHIADPRAVRRSRGALEVRGKTAIRSPGAATRLADAVRQSNELTVEAWIRPAKTGQDGPARIVTLSRNPSQRNFTLGQDGNRFDVRLRTTETNDNGIPSLSSPEESLAARLTHVVYTRDRSGRARMYVNNRLVAEDTIAGTTSPWDGAFRLALANELTGDRPWLGTFDLVAVYDKALSASEVQQNFAAGALVQATPPPREPRVHAGLEVLYDFDAGSGSVVEDRSGTESPLNLKIEKSSAVEWRNGSLRINAPVVVASTRPADTLVEAVKQSGGLTLEAWVTPDNREQNGPARILSLSRDTGERNVTLGQEEAQFDVRLRTTETDANGLPSLSTPADSLEERLTHVVYTFAPSGTARIYLDGQQYASRKVGGEPSNWNHDFRLALANELTADRPWLGEFHLAAVYSRPLSAKEVAQNFAAGPRGTTAPADVTAEAESARLFETDVARLFGRHCLKCHDADAKKGRLDLSHKEPALAGGRSGRVIVPGRPAESLLWEYVESGTMPKERPPLSSREKRLLRQWIDSGAVWPTDADGPPAYVRDGRGDSEWVRRLTVPEYIATVRSAVGVDIADKARRILPPDLRADGFSNTAYNLNVDLGHVEAYAELAKLIVERMDVAEFAAQYAPSRKLTDANMRKLVSRMGRWVLRGPLEEDEIDAFLRIGRAVAEEGGEFDEAARYILEAMLQAPRFIYRMEKPRSDGAAGEAGGYALASRLSYILWGAPPDKELMRAAAAGELSDRDRVEEQVRRMLEDPRAVERSLRFVHEWLDLGRLENLSPDPERFPEWSEQLAEDMRAETLAFFKDVAWKQKRPLADLLNAQLTYATPRLAEFYDLDGEGEAPAEPAQQELRHRGMARYDLASVPPRGGLLTQGSILTVGGDNASTVTRGLFVLHEILDGHVDDPPPCVDTTPVPTEPGLSQRAVAEQRIADISCGGCHSQFEPLAFGLGKFDGIGAYQEKDRHGNTLRDDGELLFPGADEAVPYDSSAEMMDLLAASERVEKTIVRKLTQFALGRPLVKADEPVIEIIHESARAKGGTYESLITAIVMSKLVRGTQTEENR